jgi:hypothetical protein
MDAESCPAYNSRAKLNNWEATEKKCTAAARHIYGFMNDLASLQSWGLPDDQYKLYDPYKYAHMLRGAKDRLYIVLETGRIPEGADIINQLISPPHFQHGL